MCVLLLLVKIKINLNYFRSLIMCVFLREIKNLQEDQKPLFILTKTKSLLFKISLFRQ